MPGVIIEAANITATVMATAIVETYKAGGNPALLILAVIGIFSILTSVFTSSGKALSQLFIVFIAVPWLFIEFLIKKYKKKKDVIIVK
jgi:hypothetical protein